MFPTILFHFQINAMLRIWFNYATIDIVQKLWFGKFLTNTMKISFVIKQKYSYFHQSVAEGERKRDNVLLKLGLKRNIILNRSRLSDQKVQLRQFL